MKKLIYIIIILSTITCCFANETSASDFSLLGSQKIFKLSPLKDSLLLGGGALLLGTDIILDKVVKFNRITPDEYTFDKGSIPLLDQLFMNDFSKPLDYVATGTAFLTCLAPAVLCIEPTEEWFTIAAMYCESMLVTEGIIQLGKILVNRPRPYMYFDNYPEDEIENGDWAKSWPSSHTTIAFNGAMFTSYVFCQYNPESDFRIPVIATSFAIATGTGILRMLSGNHYFSDVLSGAIIGTITGFVVPWCHKVNNALESHNTSIALSPYGFNVCIKTPF